jgi:signal transduction histidine kinase
MSGARLDLLRTSDLFARCDDDELRELAARSAEVRLEGGALLFAEEDRAGSVWLLLEGELVLTRVIDGDEVVLDHLEPPAYLGEISLLSGSPAGHRARARGPARLLEVPGDVFRELLRSCDAVLETVVRTLAGRMLRVERLLQQRERMAGLGTLAAGLAHELNNPASAAYRAAGLLREHFAALEPLAMRLAEHPWQAGEVGLLRQLADATQTVSQSAIDLAPLARADRVEDVERWLDGRGVPRPWELAPVLVDRGVTAGDLERLTRGCEESSILDALAWTERTAAIRQLLDEIGRSTARISETVHAVKAYSFVDTTALRSADVHEAIENSLTILGHKLRQARATVVRDYDRTLPPVESYGTELTQVWTNLLDNAADAVAPSGGTVRVRTGAADDGIEVEIADSGPGIPPETRERIFDAFFTTKGAGKGTGLGLEIVSRIVTRHHGTIGLSSAPGDTRFIVRLPLTQPRGAAGAATVREPGP